MFCLLVVLAIKAGGDHPFARKPVPMDDMEARITVALKIELSKERARRVYPELEEPGNQLARRMAEIYAQWQAADDERLKDPDFPFLLAKAAAIPSL